MNNETEPYCGYCTDGVDEGPYCGLPGCKPKATITLLFSEPVKPLDSPAIRNVRTADWENEA